jgi:hypothetical protein
MANCALMNAVNFCTAYHRTAKHVQDKPIDTWPPHVQHQLGAMLTQLNLGLTDRLEEVQAHNLGTHRACLALRTGVLRLRIADQADHC